MSAQIVDFRPRILKIANAITTVDQRIYAILNQLSPTQLEALADKAGVYVRPSTLKADVRLAYDVGDIPPDDVFDIIEA